jgi:hypothetical protein
VVTVLDTDAVIRRGGDDEDGRRLWKTLVHAGNQRPYGP